MNNPIQFVDPSGHAAEIGGRTEKYIPLEFYGMSRETQQMYVDRYLKYGENAVPKELLHAIESNVRDQEYIQELAEYGPAGAGVRIIKAGNAVITAINGAKVAQRVNTIVKVGDKIGNLGTLVNNPGIKVSWESARQHALNRIAQKGVTSEMFESWVKNGKAIMQDENTYLFLTKEGVAVVSKEGIPQTAYTAEYFKDHIKNAITQIFGK
ncbi:hypothetical protein P9579_15025 [Brevibacillus choshinensis]|nr:hypothetical protein [Brevibacillus choshinensis]